jgi:hypothetical protein
MRAINRCPLCLKELRTGETFLRVCRAHDEPVVGLVEYRPAARSPFACDAEDCPGRESALPLAHGLFLLHEGCVCENPFWNATANKVDVPEVALVDWASGTRSFEHWEVDVLRELAQVAPDRKEMWFPAALFEALNSSGRRRRTGCLLLLHGPKSSGKTILATMAMNPGSFDHPARTLNVGFEVEHFIYVSPGQAGTVVSHTAFLQALYPLSLFRANAIDKDWATATAPMHRHVRATFVRPTPDGEQAGGTAEEHGFLNGFPKFWRDGGAPSETDYLSIVFYDPAGEVSDNPADPFITKLSRSVDAQAVLLDASELGRFGGAVPSAGGALNTIALAVDRLAALRTNRSKRCIVVTKVDRVVNKLDRQEKAFVGGLKDGRMADPDEAKRVLLSWLSGGNDQEKRLARMLNHDQSCGVLFVWALHLDDASMMPRGVGTIDLLAWCLGKNLVIGMPAGD